MGGILKEMTDDNKQLPIPSNSPTGLPPWVVGAAFLITTFISSLTGAYISVAGTVDKYIESQKEIKLLELKARVEDNVKKNVEFSAMRTQLSELSDNVLREHASTQQSFAAQATQIAALQRTLEAAKMRIKLK